MEESAQELLAIAAIMFAIFGGIGAMFHGLSLVTINKNTHYHCNCEHPKEETAEEG